MKVFKILLKTLFTKTERFLIQNNQEFILTSNTYHNVQQAKYDSKELGLGAHYRYLLDQVRPKCEQNGLKD